MNRYNFNHEENSEEESVFISMTDMTVSFLFIIMILLAFFASRFNEKETITRPDHLAIVSSLEAEIKKLKEIIEELDRIDPLEQYITESNLVRKNLLNKLKNELKIKFPLLPVEVIPEEGTLRFQGEGLFKSNSYNLDNDKKQVIVALTHALNNILPCYTFGDSSKWTIDCNPGKAVIESLFIEGHTDSKGEDLYNLNLSTNRAVTTYSTMIDTAKKINEHFNYKNQPVLSIAGYGETRPVVKNSSDENMAINRRIDIRIIMYTPTSTKEIELIKSRFNDKFNGINNEIK